MSLPISPLAPPGFPDIPQIDGVRLATIEAGVRYSGRTDVLLAQLDPGTTIAGTFTKSSTRSASVRDCEAKLGNASEGPAVIVVNSGNSNAFTGRAGTASVEAICTAAAEATGVPVTRVFTSSTGVIGEPLPHQRIVGVMNDLARNAGQDGFDAAARAIMTTDTYAKGAHRTVDIDGAPVHIAGIAKGSGMVAPDMATMLVYIFTDAAIDQASLQQMVSAGTDRTFNCITVDSDTSTSDTLLVAATGAAQVDVSGNALFADALEDVMRDLAHQVVRDGEGATKFVEIAVTGAASHEDAHVHARAIANSPLVKTAIAGEDPNWGRVVMAIGKSGAAADRDRLRISFGEILVAENGFVSPTYREEDAAAYMTGTSLVIRVDLGLGSDTATVWTCDLTHGYISINADYRS
ncbi:MAG: bifunctional glutamate N-acetyltransferase/amino-acid acetyltransferase ArgJ [Pseudomonadota bacterium]